MSSGEIKVTDKRIFTPDGRLRDEYSHLEGARVEAPASEAIPAEKSPAEEKSAGKGLGPPEVREVPGQPAREAPPAAAAPSPPLEVPGSSLGLGQPTFLDLVSLLAEHCALYLGDLGDAEGQPAENLELARLHIDLLDILRTKTAGNLESREAAMLDDVLYQLRVRFVQKRGG